MLVFALFSLFAAAALGAPQSDRRAAEVAFESLKEQVARDLASAGPLDGKPDHDSARSIFLSWEIGLFDIVEIEECADRETCFGANPSTPYGAFGFTNRSSLEDFPGAFDLGPDEAVVSFGITPPETEYFSLAPYLFDSQLAPGARFPYFASIGDSENNFKIAAKCADGDASAVFNKPFVAWMTGNKVMDDYLATIFWYYSCKLRFPIPADTVKLGAADDSADRLFLLLRAASFASEIEQNLWEAVPLISAFRVRFRWWDDFEPFTEAEIRAGLTPFYLREDGAATEDALAQPLTYLVDSVQAEIDAGWSASAVVTELVPLGYFPASVPDYTVGLDCLTAVDVLTGGPVSCLGDVRDTTYYLTQPLPLPTSESYTIAMGVIHSETGKATYTNVAAYDFDKQYSPKAFIGDELKAPEALEALGVASSDADKLYAVVFARSCSAVAAKSAKLGALPCFDLDMGEFPGIPEQAPIQITQRAYMDPESGVAPDRTTLQRLRAFAVVA